MSKAQDILKFDFSTVAFQQSAELVIPQRLNSILDIRIKKLQKICDSLGMNPFPSIPSLLIPEVFRKFKALNQSNNLIFNRKELRTLSYAFNYSENNLTSIFSNLNELKIALVILDNEWRDAFIGGLLDLLLRNWESKHKNSLAHLEQFILIKLNKYSGNRSTLTSFKTNQRFFNLINGDLVLGSEIALKNISINEATKFLSLPETWFNYPYFSKVIVAYFEKKQNDLTNIITDVEQALRNHNQPKTNKRLSSKLIIQANKPEFTHLQDKIKSLAFNFIGDPENKGAWSDFEDATVKEKEELGKARVILNEWITRQFINVFFNVCINDKRRKAFWLKYASKVSSFKVYGSAATKFDLKQDKRVSEYLENRFVQVQSSTSASAFILYMGNYMLIEFSKDGYAFYGYKLNGSKLPNIKRYLNSVDDLRDGNLPLAVNRRREEIIEHQDEGRLFHKDGNYQDGTPLKWENIFDWWLENYNII
jgi:hypothetical protein